MGAMGMRGTSVPFGIFTAADGHTAFAMGGGGGGLFGRGSSFGVSGSRFSIGDGGGGGFGGGRGFASGGSGQRFPGGGHGSTGLFDLDFDDDMSDEKEEVGKPLYSTKRVFKQSIQPLGTVWWGLEIAQRTLRPTYPGSSSTARSRAYTEQLPEVCCLTFVTSDAHSTRVTPMLRACAAPRAYHGLHQGHTSSLSRQL